MSTINYSLPSNGVDDTFDIQNVFNSLTNGGEVVFEDLTYIVTTLTLPSNIVVLGMGVTLKQKDGTNNLPIFHLNNVSNVEISGVNLDGNIGNVTGNLANGIRVSGSNNIILENLFIEKIRRVGIYLDFFQDEPCENIIINNCIGQNFGVLTEGIYSGIFFSSYGAKSVKIENILTEDINGVVFLMLGSKDFTLNNFHLKSNLFDDGVSAVGCQNMNITNGVIEGMGHWGIELNQTELFKITNIEIKNCELGCILISTYIDGEGYATGLPSKFGEIDNIICEGEFDPQPTYRNILLGGCHNICLSGINVKTKGNVEFVRTYVSDSVFYNCENITIKNSKILSLFLQYACKISIINNNLFDIVNTNSSYLILRDTNSFEIFFKAACDDNSIVIFNLPTFTDNIGLNDPGFINGIVIIDNAFDENPIGQFSSEIYHVRSISENTNTLPWVSQKIGSTLIGPITARAFNVQFFQNGISIENVSGAKTIVRCSIKSMFDTWG